MELLHQHYPDEWHKDIVPLLIRLYTVDDITDVWPLLNSIASATIHLKPIKLQFGSTFEGLQAYYGQLEKKEKKIFLSTIKTISSYAQMIEKLLPRHETVKLLRRKQPGDIIINRQLIACLLAHSFLCLHPTKKRPTTFPEMNFTEIFRNEDKNKEKLKCLLKYFERLSANNNKKFDELINKNIVFVRVVTPNDHISWNRLKNSEKKLCKLRVDLTTRIEDTAKTYARVDFANAYLGGGVLNTGCVQEEIMFTICPELIAGMLIMESMNENEAIIISGFEKYCDYDGYARTFQFKEDYYEADGAAEKNYVVAIDALDYRYRDASNQFKNSSMLREITKAYSGFSKFSSTNSHNSYPKAIATGNWGCGAFLGHPVLKSLLQWVAASEAGCSEMLYCTFNHQDLACFQALATMFVKIYDYKKVRDLAALLQQLSAERPSYLTYDVLFRKISDNKKRDES